MSKWQHTSGAVITAAPGSFRETLCKGSPDWQPASDETEPVSDDGPPAAPAGTGDEKPKRSRPARRRA